MFVYYPGRATEAELLTRAAALGIEPWPAAGETRMGWRAPGAAPSDGRPNHRALVFHGNAGHSLDRAYFAGGLRSVQAADWEVHLLEYPGYGSRPGRPSERAFVDAAVAAVDLLVADDPTRPVYLIGESIGSGVASQVAAARPDAVPAILLITPFTNLVDVGSARAPRILVQTLLRERYDSEAALASYRGRVGVLLAGRDEVIPVELGKLLYDGYAGVKRLWIQESAGHNTLDYTPGSPWWEDVTRYLTGVDHLSR